jgi:hypothetical protein
VSVAQAIREDGAARRHEVMAIVAQCVQWDDARGSSQPGLCYTEMYMAVGVGVGRRVQSMLAPAVEPLLLR